jgi:hypothetical protein
MLTKKIKMLLPILITVLLFWMKGPSVHAKNSSFKSPHLDYAGKSYAGAQDPSYLNYDLALREYMVYRINKHFGITIDPKTYSGFDLLEIEALLKCKKKEESLDLFLNMFPKGP